MKKNKYDDAVSDWFHSRTFKVLMTIAAAIFVVVVLCVCVSLIGGGGLLIFLKSKLGI